MADPLNAPEQLSVDAYVASLLADPDASVEPQHLRVVVALHQRQVRRLVTLVHTYAHAANAEAARAAAAEHELQRMAMTASGWAPTDAHGATRADSPPAQAEHWDSSPTSSTSSTSMDAGALPLPALADDAPPAPLPPACSSPDCGPLPQPGGDSSISPCKDQGPSTQDSTRAYPTTPGPTQRNPAGAKQLTGRALSHRSHRRMHAMLRMPAHQLEVWQPVQRDTLTLRDGGGLSLQAGAPHNEARASKSPSPVAAAAASEMSNGSSDSGGSSGSDSDSSSPAARALAGAATSTGTPSSHAHKRGSRLSRMTRA